MNRYCTWTMLIGWTLCGCGCDERTGFAEGVAGSAVSPMAGVESSVEKWGLAVPVVDGYSDPNRIVYDDAYLRAYKKRRRIIRCGMASYIIVSRKYSISVLGGLDETPLGHRFRLDDLLRFLETRRDNPNFEQVFPVRDTELLKKLRDGNYGWDPWTSHLQMTLTLVGSTAYKPAIPLLTALATKDPDSRIRVRAARALGWFSRAHPEALEALNLLAADPARSKEAEVGLQMAKSVGGPMVFAKPLDQPDAKYGPVSAHELE